ncbi:hypothetical protein [Gallibacterium anatis]|uniref:hypothetical protein n=1 Tax=Gallibacterium anatis TaxID=750 RepID=UPI000802664E|nr:hypothetical protein [Gallibacterium anatis]OBW97502.1 hypothetical protein QV02_00355 [Gallibacterium anatis]
MSIKANITILNDEKYEKIAKKPITLLFQNKLTLKQKREFFYFLLGYFILVPIVVVQLLTQENAILGSTLGTILAFTCASLLGLFAVIALAKFVNNLLKEYRIALYKDSYDEQEIEEVFSLFGAVLTKIRKFEKHKHTQESLTTYIVEELKLIGERKVQGIFAEMNKFINNKINKNQ